MTTQESIEVRARREIDELHRFFQEWFRGEAERDSLSRLTAALAPDFVLIGPAGQILDRDVVVSGVASQYGSDPEARLWIERVTVRRTSTEMVLVTYEEWQERSNGTARGRLSTVIFGTGTGFPNGLQWLHLHETWLERSEGPRDRDPESS